ncbi:uncharacterized protein EDB91DRAFT_1028323, partial [Suillus paluster]|uniref:uncharacterized protein n=1 Tax=Suillus paluster TaxID=48578 RepID=UPI001B863B2F
ASHLVQEICTAEVRRLASEDSGSHFGASSATTKQLEDFSVEDMAQEMIRSAPELWALLGALLGEGEKCSLPVSDEVDGDGDAVMGDSQSSEDDDSYWDQVEAVDLEGFINGLASENVSKKDIRSSRHSAIIKTKKVVIISIMMQSTRQKSNALQSIIGIFLQSVHTPQNVIDTLARIGISISTDAINAAVKSLSVESQNTIRDLGQTLLASYAYDNFDVDL